MQIQLRDSENQTIRDRGLVYDVLKGIADTLNIDMISGSATGRYVGVCLRPASGSDKLRSRKNGRRINAVCYHGHLAFMQGIFEQYPLSIVKSTVTKYDGAADFQRAYDMGENNVGSMMYPQEWQYACDCLEYADFNGEIEMDLIPQGRHK